MELKSGPGFARDVAAPATLDAQLARFDLSRPQDQERAWRELLGGPLADRAAPFDAYRDAFRRVYAARDARRDGPPPAWFPEPEDVARTNPGRWMRERGAPDFREFHRWTVEHRDEFWEEFLRRIHFPFKTRPTRMRDPASPATRPEWLPGARLNASDICLRGDRDRPAILYGREGTHEIDRWTYGRLAGVVGRVVSGLDRVGLGDHDRVALYLPMTPESVAIYLGVVKSGRAAVGIADASAPPEVEKRCRISEAKLLFTVDAYVRDGKTLRIYEKAKAAHAPRCVVLPGDGTPGGPSGLRPGDAAWEDFLGPAEAAESRARAPSDETNILFSSGTTKDPKAIVWTHATPMRSLADAYLHQNVQSDDVLAWPTSFGWMMGPWLTYASLGLGATMALYNGSPLVAGFGRFVQDAGVTMVGVVPKIVKAWRSAKTMEPYDWSRVRRFSSTGETSDPEDMLYLMWLAGTKPIVEYCGGTEIGGGYITGSLAQPASPATFSTPSCGLDFRVLDESGRPTERGEVAIVPPSMGLSNTLLNYDHDEEYYGGFFRGPAGEALRRHGDQVERLGGGYFRHHGRVDDMINLNGVKTSVEELRAVINHHPLVDDTKPISVDVEGKGQRVLVVYAVPADKKRLADGELAAELRSGFSRLIRERLNPLLSQVHEVVLVADLPQAGPGKTRTQKEFVADYLGRVASPPAPRRG